MSTEIKKEIPLEIAHVLLIDVVGYSKLLVNEQIEFLQELNQIVRSTECFRAAETKGKLIRVSTGDGMALLFFHSPEEPVRCALEISRTLQEHPHIQLRMGVHSGPVNQVTDVNDKTNIAGSGINVAQRVMDCGDAGHILLSGHIAEDLTQYRQWQPYLHDLGECEVKHGLRLHLVNLYKDNLGNPHLPDKLKRGRRWKHASGVSIHPVITPRWPKYVLTAVLLLSAVALAISFSVFYRRGSAAVARSSSGKAADGGLPIAEKSIAVLPFENRSDEKANAYFADGIQDEILTRLAKISDLKVISRTSTQHYKSTPQNLREIAKQLGVAHIVEGSVQKSGDAVRVNVQLIKAENDTHLWADTFDRKLTDIFSVESDIAKSIADQLQAKLTGAEQQIVSAEPTNSVEAYDAYLRGLAYTLRASNNPAAALGAQKYFREAARLDPKFALGWAQLSIVDSRNYLTQSLQPTVALREEARLATETALNLQPELGEAILARGSYYYYCLKDYDAAVRYFEQARQLLPNSSRIPESLAYIARKQGQWDRSEAYFAEAQRLDPRNVNLLIQHAINDICHRRFRKALRKLDEALNITPDDLNILVAKAGIAQAEGDLPRASALLAQVHFTAEDIEGPETQAYQAILEGRPASAIPLLKNVLSKPDPALGYFNAVLRFWLGWAQEAAGDKVDAQQTWQQAREELETFLKEQPDNYLLMSNLALVDLGLGDKTAALDLSARAMAVNPVEKDVVTGPIPLEILARVAARAGDSDRAIATLEKLLSTPYNGALAAGMPLTPALLRLDPMFDPLRNDPRFKKIVASQALNNTKR
jgi:TolB-like protein/Tfp pilus assembly protein PilF